MVTRNEVYAAIEGSRILVVGQKIMPTGNKPQRLSESKEIVYPLKVSRRGKSTIEEGNNPKQPRFKPYSLLDSGDSIEGNHLWGFSSNFIGRDNLTVGGSARTGRHPGQELTISGICFMELIDGWVGSAIDVHPKEVLLQT